MRTIIPIAAFVVIITVLLASNCEGCDQGSRGGRELCSYDLISSNYTEYSSKNHPASSETDFDIYTPACPISKRQRGEKRTAATEKLPLLILLHEGAFLPKYNHKNSVLTELLSKILASKGIAVANIDYRAIDNANSYLNAVNDCVMAATQDTHAALSYFEENAEQYNIDPDRIFIGGYSAGAIIALHTAFYRADEYDGYSDYDNAKLAQYASYAHPSEAPIAGVISISGGLPNPNIIDANDHEDLPILLYHNTRDSIVPCESGTIFEKYTDKDYNVGLIDVDPGSYTIGGLTFDVRRPPSIHIPGEILSAAATFVLPRYYGGCELNERIRATSRLRPTFIEGNGKHSPIHNRRGEFKNDKMTDLTNEIVSFIERN